MTGSVSILADGTSTIKGLAGFSLPVSSRVTLWPRCPKKEPPGTILAAPRCLRRGTARLGNLRVVVLVFELLFLCAIAAEDTHSLTVLNMEQGRILGRCTCRLCRRYHFRDEWR